MTQPLDKTALDQLFNTARTANGWTDRPLNEHQIRELYDAMKMGPTSANCSPGRFVWVNTTEGKSKLAECASEPNRARILAAPVTVIIGHDPDFAQLMPKLFPARGEMMKSYFSDPRIAESTAFRNGTLQGAYLIIAARALGLDCGPMSGFDHAKVDESFFAGTRYKSNFICGLGYGSGANPFPRNPRLSFDEVSRFA